MVIRFLVGIRVNLTIFFSEFCTKMALKLGKPTDFHKKIRRDLTLMRLQWLWHYAFASAKGKKFPTVVQVLLVFIKNRSNHAVPKTRKYSSGARAGGTWFAAERQK